MWGCVTGSSVRFSKYWTAYFQHSGVISQDWCYLRRNPRGRGKQGVRNDSFQGKRRSPCLFCLSFLKCSFFGLDKLLNFWTGLFELTHSHHPKGPIALLAYQCDRKHSIASQRSSLKLLSPKFLLGQDNFRPRCQAHSGWSKTETIVPGPPPPIYIVTQIPQLSSLSLSLLSLLVRTDLQEC